MIELDGKDILVVGLGESGYAASTVARALGASVTAIDRSRRPAKLGRLSGLESDGVNVMLGVDVPDDLARHDLVVTSPGVPDRAPVLMSARDAGLKVISELELAFRLLDNPMVAVTGTNGKTTTTTLIARMMDRPRRRAFACGNIGTPLVSLYGNVDPADVLVVEVSSFQLQNIEEFHAQVSVALNIAPDHFDWHRDMDEYRGAKMRLVENVQPGEYLIFNSSEEFCVSMAGACRGINIGFGVERPPGEGLWTEDGWIMAGPPFEAGKVMPVEEVGVPGEHNLDNVMAALAASLAMGEHPEHLRKVAAEFNGLEHRMEFVSTVGEVSFYNDSKATNPHAALQAIRSFDEPIVAIMGGRNKGLDMGELVGELCRGMADGTVRGMVLMGESAGELEAALDRECRDLAAGHLEVAKGMDDSVRTAYRLSGGDGVVLLTPACASFDMFTDYKDRGRVFKESVGKLEGGGDDGRRG